MSDYPILKEGDSGPEVRHLKALLAAKGMHRSSDDPHFYKATGDAVRLFQTAHVGVDGRPLIESQQPGVVTEATWMALEGRIPQRIGLRPMLNIARMNSPRRELLAACQAFHQQGVKEVPKGSNWGDGVRELLEWHGSGPVPWCNAAVNYALHKAGLPAPCWGKSMRVCATWNKARAAGQAIRRSEVYMVCPGDLFVMLHEPLLANGSAPDCNGHIGVIGGTDGVDILTFEGNSDDRWAARRRKISSLVGIIRLWPHEYFALGFAPSELATQAPEKTR